MSRVDILMAVRNGVPFVEEQIESLRAQTHGEWRLWIRDDQSTDDTVDFLRGVEQQDERIRLLEAGGERLGPGRGFGRLLERSEIDAPHTMFCDADDVWLPRKIETTLEAMDAAESRRGEETALLVHTDLKVVGANLEPLGDSFWAYQRLYPERATFRRLLVNNTVTGPTIMINRSLRLRAMPIPAEAWAHDWWLALVASRFGRIVPLREQTVLYRQHGRNKSGAQHMGGGVKGLLRRARTGARNSGRLREHLRVTAEQAGAFLDRYGPELTDRERKLLARYAGIPNQRLIPRKLSVLRLRLVPEHGILRNLGVLLRA